MLKSFCQRPLIQLIIQIISLQFVFIISMKCYIIVYPCHSNPQGPANYTVLYNNNKTWIHLDLRPLCYTFLAVLLGYVAMSAGNIDLET